MEFITRTHLTSRKQKRKIMKTLLTLIFLTAFLGSSAQDHWETLCKEKPQTALHEARKLFEKARKTDDSPEMLRALLIQIHCLAAIDQDSIPALIRTTEKVLKNSENQAEQSLLHSLLADLYLYYYNQNYDRIDSRTPLNDYIPEDLNAWDREAFYSRIRRHALSALQPVSLLEHTLTSTYKPLLLPGKDSPSLRPTLLDFLSYRSIAQLKPFEYRSSPEIPQTVIDSLMVPLSLFTTSSLPATLPASTLDILKIYQNLLRFRKSASNPEALLATELNRLEYIQNLSPGNTELYLRRLEELADRYEGTPFVVEVIAQLAQTRLATRKDRETEILYPEILALCQRYVRKYPSYPRINLLKQIIATINLPDMQVQYNNYIYPGQFLSLQTFFYRAKEIKLDIYRIKKSTTAYYRTERDSSSTNKQLIFSKKYTLPFRYIKQDTTFRIPIVHPGLYEVVLQSPNSKKLTGTFICSSLFPVSQRDNQKTTFIVRDRMSGAPVPHARIRLLEAVPGKYRNYKFLAEIHTNAQGVALYNNRRSHLYYEVTDNLNPNGPICSDYYDPQQRNFPRFQAALFTDRPLYRPGQLLSFYGMVWTQTPDSTSLETDRTYEISLHDANRRLIKKSQVKSNAWGSFSGSFLIPAQTLNGEFFLSIEGKRYASITVAEYKRPQTELLLYPQKEAYAFGDQIRLTGKVRTYSGISLPEIPIRYEITLHTYYRPGNYSDEIITGQTRSDAEGNFSLDFPASEPASSSRRNAFYYQIKVTATDSKGESQEIIQFLPVQTSFYKLAILGKTYVDKSGKNCFYIQAINATREKISRTVFYSISKLKSLTSLRQFYHPDSVRIEKTLCRGKLNTLTDSVCPDFSSWASGAYLIQAQENLPGRDSVSVRKIIYLYSAEDTRPPYLTYNWLPQDKISCNPGESAEINFGTSARNIYLWYEVYTYKGLVQQKQMILSDTILRLKVPYEKDYGNNFYVNLSFIKDDRFFENNIRIYSPQSGKRLELRTEVFRDKLIPGQAESWEFSIRDTAGKGVIAEVAALMYDLSLEKFKPHNWYFQPHFYYLFPDPVWNYNRQNRHYFWFNFRYPSLPYPEFLFDRLKDYGFPFHPYTFYPAKMLFARASGVTMDDAVSASVYANPESSASLQEETVISPQLSKNSSPPQKDAPFAREYNRENFAETAFFYPHLLSNDSGWVKLRFRVPETLTRWKFIALAHTKELAYGKIEKEITTQKAFSLMPNIPRFFRNGDRTVLKATVSNLSAETVKGEATLELFLPTDTSVVLLRKTDFETEAGKSRTLSFEFTVPQNVSLLGCRIKACSSHFSDGEQHLIPVLPDRLLLTEALPFYANEKGLHRFQMQAASQKKQNYRLTLELTANPVWYAVLALPPLQQAQNDNITDVAAAFYSNAIGHAIVRSNPFIASAINTWEKSVPSSPTLWSKLEQNAELKSLLLESTPWVLDAQNETERMQSLSQLFDLNRLADLQNRALQKMADLQNANGGWSWFKGMPASPFMTYNALTTMAQAAISGQREAGEKEKMMQIKALGYIDREIVKDFLQQDTTLNYERLLYLYTRSFYTDIPLGNALQAHKTLMHQLEKRWVDLSLYEKALSATVFFRYGMKPQAERVLNSIKEYATLQPDLGMFWANNRSAYYRNSAILIHTTIMEAFHEIQGNSSDTDLMKQWLLRQKQTQMWGDVPSTVQAIYALLLTGNPQLGQPERLTVALGKKDIDLQTDNILGYVKQTYTAGEITPDMSTVTLNKQENTPTWGALYLQYFDRLKNVREKKNSILRVNKQLFVERITETGKKLHPVDRELHVGDKVIVRLTVTVDRDMEYIHLKDLRAACFEPVQQISRNQQKFGTYYYEEIKDAVTNFFIHYLPKGTYTFEYALWVNQEGKYQDGIATLQCLYAPEFVSHSSTTEIKVISD